LQLNRELTALENLQFFAEVRGLRRAPSWKRCSSRLGWAGAAATCWRLIPRAWASGCVMRYALLHEPPALLLDKPTVTLDERGAEVVERIVQAQRERGILVIATNDPRELRYGDYVLRLGGL